MRIEALKINEPFEKITVKIIEKPEKQERNYFNQPSFTCNCKVEDGTGEAFLLLYNDDILRVRTNSIVEITNGYCKISQGKPQLAVENGSMAILFKDSFPEQRTTTFLEDIESMLDSSNTSFRINACEILGEKGKASERAISRLIALSKKEQYTIAALKSLVEIAKLETAVRKRFPEIMDREDEQLRYDSFLAVFVSEDSNINDISEYLPYLADKDARIRKIARVKLLQIETMRATLQVVFDSNNIDAIDELFTELPRFSDKIIESALYNAFNHDNTYVNVSALKLAKQLGLEKKIEKDKEKRKEELKDTFTAI